SPEAAGGSGVLLVPARALDRAGLALVLPGAEAGGRGPLLVRPGDDGIRGIVLRRHGAAGARVRRGHGWGKRPAGDVVLAAAGGREPGPGDDAAVVARRVRPGPRA